MFAVERVARSYLNRTEFLLKPSALTATILPTVGALNTRRARRFPGFENLETWGTRRKGRATRVRTTVLVMHRIFWRTTAKESATVIIIAASCRIGYGS